MHTLTLITVSGEPAQEPVASRKTGTVYEKRLIEAYLSQHGSDPVTGEPLDETDLLPLQSSQVPRPRPPTQTSLPALLATFQNEWDAVALESFQLRKSLAQTRQELSTALYDYEGALRLLAKVTKERDEARDALSKVQVGAGASRQGGDAMEVDGVELPDDLAEKVDETQKTLSSTRRKRPVPEDWITGAELQEAEESSPAWASKIKVGKCSALTDGSNLDSGLIAYGTESGSAFVYSESLDASTTLKLGSRISDVVAWEDKAIFSLANGSIVIDGLSDNPEILSVHAGAATGVSLHPGGEILGSVGSDSSYVIYDLTQLKPVTRVFADTRKLPSIPNALKLTCLAFTCCQFHPDGNLFAAGATDGRILIFNIKTGEIAATFPTEASVKAINFSENGYWLASASKSSTSVTVWDLRKAGDQAKAKVIEFGGQVSDLAWDYTGQFLAIVGSGSLVVQQYVKSSKKWSEIVKKAVDGRKLAWDLDGQYLLVDGDGSVVQFGK
jgi:pre-mRNA-processing factor 19